ncbi:surface lipoprotein assembly modifier [Mangrovicoccus ximenensis]|uniref:surface lipoprotein assembly modifier n=1 Tax=Mangrovicoccus ximenensis TaxID=1911570 RepID=UPI0013750450|nr:surface lipoprotein assembly modifier [Mangrovicoccus ximenensis]
MGLPVLLLGAVRGQQAGAQQAPGAALAGMLDRPDDPAAMFRYGRAAADAGDLDAVAAALERLLATRPGLSNIRFELGLLHLRGGNAGLATIYLRDALADPDVPPEIRGKGMALIAEAGQAQSVWDRWGTASLGLQHHTNANSGPDGTVQFVTSTGEVEGRLRSEDTGHPDTALVLSLSGGISADLGLQAGHRFVLPGTLHFERYREQSSLDIGYAGLSPGLAFDLSHVAGAPAQVTVSLPLACLTRGGDDYLAEAGLAVEGTWRSGRRTLLRAGLTAKRQDFRDTPDAPSNDNRDGLLSGLYLGVVRDIGTRLQVSAEVFGRRKGAAEEYEAYRERGAWLQIRRLFDAGRMSAHGPWEARLFAAYSVVDYDDLDTAIDLDTSQKDKRTQIRAELSIPVGERLDLTAGLGWYDNNSNFAIRDYEDGTAELRVEHRF